MPTISYTGEIILLGENTIQANLIVETPIKTIKPIVYKALLDCFIKVESGGNPLAFNPKDIDGRPKYGCLQYDARTFSDICVKELGLEDNIWSCEIQSACWQEMYLSGRVGHWGNLALTTCKPPEIAYKGN